MEQYPQSFKPKDAQDDDSSASGHEIPSDVSDDEQISSSQNHQFNHTDKNKMTQPIQSKSLPSKQEEQKQNNLKSEKKRDFDEKQEKIKIDKIKSPKKQLFQSFDQQWEANQIESDEAQSLISDGDEAEINLNTQNTAFFEQDDINNLSVMNQQEDMNNAFIGKEMSIKYEHWVENKHLLVLYLLFRKEIYELFPKQQYNRIDVHPANKNKIRIFGISHQEIKDVSSKISQIINKIAILKLNIRNDEAMRLKSSKLLNKKLLKDKMVIFKFGNSGDKSYYLGGKGTQPQLSCVFKDIRNLKFRYFRMFDYPNTRSYKIIIGSIIKQKEFLKAFSKWNLKNVEIVSYIPNFNALSSKKETEKSLCFLMTTVGRIDNFSPKEIENNLAPFIKNNFYSIVFIFRKGDKYLPKLSVEGIFFKYVSEKKLPWSYIYVMSLKKNFFEKREAIIKELEKLSEKKLIYGVRFFNNLSPQKSEYIMSENYKEIKYPQNGPAYSYSIIAKQVKQQMKYKENQQVQADQSEKMEEHKGEMKQKENESKKYYSFDWKEHILNLQPTEISFIPDIKN